MRLSVTSLHALRAPRPTAAHRTIDLPLRLRNRRVVVVRANLPDNKRKGNDARDRDGALNKALQSASATWSKLDLQQRAFTVVAGVALLAALPQILTVLLIALERVLVGGLLALEEALAGLLFMSTRLVVAVGSIVLLAAGLYVFLFKKPT